MLALWYVHFHIFSKSLQWYLYTGFYIVVIFVVFYLLSHVQLFCNPMDCSLPGSSICGIFQARVLEWVAISFSRGPSWPRDQTQVSRIVDRGFTVWATREVRISCKYTYIPSLLNPPPTPTSYASRSSQSTQLSSLCYHSFPLAICFTHCSVYMYIYQCCSLSSSHLLLSQLCPQVCSLYLCLYFCPANRFLQYHFSRFCIYALMYHACSSLSDLLHSVWQTLGSSTSLQMTQFYSFLWLNSIPSWASLVAW